MTVMRQKNLCLPFHIVISVDIVYWGWNMDFSAFSLFAAVPVALQCNSWVHWGALCVRSTIYCRRMRAIPGVNIVIPNTGGFSPIALLAAGCWRKGSARPSLAITCNNDKPNDTQSTSIAYVRHSYASDASVDRDIHVPSEQSTICLLPFATYTRVIEKSAWNVCLVGMRSIILGKYLLSV